MNSLRLPAADLAAFTQIEGESMSELRNNNVEEVMALTLGLDTEAEPIVHMSTVWAVPSRWTFQIPPIAAFIKRHLPRGVIVDPFCGTSTLATLAQDLAQDGVDAGQYCERLRFEGVVADAVLFDPPYSPRQISECYKSIGLKATGKDTQNAALYARVRRPLTAILKRGGVALSFGWQSSGFSKKEFRTTEILLVQHGGAHNDTICVAQVKL